MGRAPVVNARFILPADLFSPAKLLVAFDIVERIT
jgi:hypothetical protein